MNHGGEGVVSNEVMNIDKKSLEKIASQYFCEACGFNTKDEKYEKMYQEALLVRDEMINQVNVRAVARAFNEIHLMGQVLTLDHISLNCNAFEQFEMDNIKSIYVYVLTAGDPDIESESALHKYYAYTWGTAYVDAGRDFLRDTIQERFQEKSDEPVFVSDSFGPGYYGMKTEDISKIFELIDADKIDVKLIKGTMIHPIKTCSGLYIVTNDESHLPKVDCKACISNPKGCHFCRMKKI